jgi:hypothetical protein
MPPPFRVPPRFSRVTIGCLIVAALLVVLWILGDTRVQRIAYHWQEQVNQSTAVNETVQSRPGTAPVLDAALALRKISLSNNSGVVTVAYSQYTSYHSNPDELLKLWKHHHGWAMNAHSKVPRSNPFIIPAHIAYTGVQVAGLGIIQSSRQGEDSTALRVPIPFLIVFMMIPPAIAAWRRHRLLQRSGSGQCLCCGYLLDGAAICPECGTPVAAG